MSQYPGDKIPKTASFAEKVTRLANAGWSLRGGYGIRYIMSDTRNSEGSYLVVDTMDPTGFISVPELLSTLPEVDRKVALFS